MTNKKDLVVLMFLCFLFSNKAFVDAFLPEHSDLFVSSLSFLQLRGKTAPLSRHIRRPGMSTTEENQQAMTGDEAVTLNQERFLSEMETSIQALMQQQEELLNALDPLLPPPSDKKDENARRPATKQDQIDRQYEPFAKLAHKAKQLEEKYAQEIQDLRSLPTNEKKSQGLAGPTQAFGALGVVIMIGAMGNFWVHTNNDLASIGWTTRPMEVPPGLGIFLANTFDKAQNILASSSTISSSASASRIVEESTTIKSLTETVSSSSSYAFKDFANFDIYGSATQVENWFSPK